MASTRAMPLPRAQWHDHTPKPPAKAFSSCDARACPPGIPQGPSAGVPYARSLSRGGPIAEVVEQGHAVGLRPDADCTRPGDMVVLQFDIGLTVEDDANLLPGEFHSESLPSSLWHRCIDILERPATAFLRVVQGDVVLQRIRSRDV